ncbi:MAG: helix-hairpin-helix domain-containing protein [Krumholzibacteria bacterium]|nr:helix-hairpin-helix domain-containing protein [Candidatus Krumholzibacteria bacterium]
MTGPLPVNTCSEDSLTLLPGVGPKLAARIAASRLADGPFRTAQDLQRVKGIGPVLAARIGPLVVFGPDSAAAGPAARKSP